MPLVKINMISRTKEQKAKAIELITANLVSRLGIEPTDIFIVITEPSLENWKNLKQGQP